MSYMFLSILIVLNIDMLVNMSSYNVRNESINMNMYNESIHKTLSSTSIQLDNYMNFELYSNIIKRKKKVH